MVYSISHLFHRQQLATLLSPVSQGLCVVSRVGVCALTILNNAPALGVVTRPVTALFQRAPASTGAALIGLITFVFLRVLLSFKSKQNEILDLMPEESSCFRTILALEGEREESSIDDELACLALFDICQEQISEEGIRCDMSSWCLRKPQISGDSPDIVVQIGLENEKSLYWCIPIQSLSALFYTESDSPDLIFKHLKVYNGKVRRVGDPLPLERLSFEQLPEKHLLVLCKLPQILKAFLNTRMPREYFPFLYEDCALHDNSHVPIGVLLNKALEKDGYTAQFPINAR